MSNILLKYTIYRWSCEKYDIRTEIVFALFTEFAVSAGLSRLQSYFVADFQMFDIFSHFHDNTTRLMTENKRWFYHIIADGSALVIMQIRSTDSYIIQLYQNFIILRVGMSRSVNPILPIPFITATSSYLPCEMPSIYEFLKLNKIVLLSFSKIPLFYGNVNYKSNIFYVQCILVSLFTGNISRVFFCERRSQKTRDISRELCD